jgi:hypothetical protein
MNFYITDCKETSSQMEGRHFPPCVTIYVSAVFWIFMQNPSCFLESEFKFVLTAWKKYSFATVDVLCRFLLSEREYRDSHGRLLPRLARPINVIQLALSINVIQLALSNFVLATIQQLVAPLPAAFLGMKLSGLEGISSDARPRPLLDGHARKYKQVCLRRVIKLWCWTIYLCFFKRLFYSKQELNSSETSCNKIKRPRSKCGSMLQIRQTWSQGAGIYCCRNHSGS